VEREIEEGQTQRQEDQILRATDDEREPRRERVQVEISEEHLYGTAVPAGMQADEKSFARGQEEATV